MNTPIRSLLAPLVAALLTTGCVGSQASRTGLVHHLTVGQDAAPTKLTVKIGDEVRWTNTGSETVTVFFNRGLPSLLCHTGFSASGLRATIEPQASAAMCFGEPGVFTYGIEAQDKDLVTSSIRVGPDQS